MSSQTLEPFVSQETDEWATPADFVRPLAAAIGGYDLDPCSGAEKSPVASETYSAEDDGLAHSWDGDVWLNPPYSDIPTWIRKAINELNAGNADSVTALVKGDTSTDWYQRYGFEADAIAFIDGRLQFDDANDAPFPSHVLVFGDVPSDVLDVLNSHGTVIRPECVESSKQVTITDI